MLNVIVKLTFAFIALAFFGLWFTAELAKRGASEVTSWAVFLLITFGGFGYVLTAVRADEGTFELSPAERTGCYGLVLLSIGMAVLGYLFGPAGGRPAAAAAAGIGTLIAGGSVFGYISLLSALFGWRGRRTAGGDPFQPRRFPHEEPEGAPIDPGRFGRDQPFRPSVRPGQGGGGHGGASAWEEFDFPEWEAAPPGAPRIEHERPYSGYTPENARRALERSNVDRSRPQDREQALHLARYLSWVLKDRAPDFIEDAARDQGLPMQVRAFYIHAAQLVGRM